MTTLATTSVASSATRRRPMKSAIVIVLLRARGADAGRPGRVDVRERRGRAGDPVVHEQVLVDGGQRDLQARGRVQLLRVDEVLGRRLRVGVRLGGGQLL